MNKKLFIVEFGKPEGANGSGRYMIGETYRQPLFVAAADYSEAIRKATIYVEENPLEKPSLLDYDGSIRSIPHEEITQVRTVRLVSDEVVW